ncbi:MAG: hypothetical protein JWR69_3548, partial [Pedosphaera sp.]|nr:hypothetical protein [Pedosphaera sp.]
MEAHAFFDANVVHHRSLPMIP